MTSKTDTEVERINQHLATVWSNIQHNERLRNTGFSLYLIVSGFFFALLGTETAVLPQNLFVFYASICVWVIGVLHLWSFTRFREMIGRDSRVMRHLLTRLAELRAMNAAAWQEYEMYYYSFDKKRVSAWGSVSACIMASTSLIATAVLVVGLWASGIFQTSMLIVMFLAILLLNRLIIWIFRVVWGVNLLQARAYLDNRMAQAKNASFDTSTNTGRG